MTFEEDGQFGSRLRGLDVPLPPALGHRVLASGQSPAFRRHPAVARLAVRTGALLATLVIVNLAALYIAPAYALGVAHLPLAGGPGSALLQSVGLSASDGTTPIGCTSTAGGEQVTLIEGTATSLRTVLLLDVPSGELIVPGHINVTDQFGHSYTGSVLEADSTGTAEFGSGMPPGVTFAGTVGPQIATSADPNQLVLVVPPLAGPAATVGARLTVRIDTLAQNSATVTWGNRIQGPWTLTANLVLQPGSDLSFPPTPQTIDGNTWRLSRVREAGGVLQVSGTLSGPSIGPDAFPLLQSALRTASGTPVTLLYSDYTGTGDQVDFDLTFARPASGPAQLQIGPATFTIGT